MGGNLVGKTGIPQCLMDQMASYHYSNLVPLCHQMKATNHEQSMTLFGLEFHMCAFLFPIICQINTFMTKQD